MTRSTKLAAGLSAEVQTVVGQEHSAPHLGSGDVAVLATPAMVALVERACAQLVEPYLADSETTVGVELHVKHIAPTPIGVTVKVLADLTAVKDDRLRFEAVIQDEKELVGRIDHERIIIDRDRFMRRVEAKRS